MRYFVLIVTAALLLLSAYFAWDYLQQRAASHAEQIELRAVYDRWNDAGRPTGEKLEKFMEGRRNFLVNSQLFTVEGTNYVGQFAKTNMMSHKDGIFVITTNKVILLISSNHAPKVIRFSAPPF
jgi:hypothetical protein